MQQKTITTDILDIAYLEYGAPDGWPCIMGHGFPYDVHAYAEAAPIRRGSGRAGPRALSARLRADAVPLGRDAALGRAGGARRRSAGASWTRSSIERAVLGGYDWGGRAACVVAALWPERVSRARLRQFATTSRTSRARWSRLAAGGGGALVSILLPQRARPARAGAQPARLRAPVVDDVVADMGVRRRDVRAQRGRRSTIPTSSMS